MKKGLIVRTNYDNKVPLIHVYTDLGICPNPQIVLKPVKHGVLIITRSLPMMRLISTRINGRRIVSFHSIKEFYQRIINNIVQCDKIEVHNATPVIIGSKELLGIINNLTNINNLQMRIDNDRITDLRVILKPHGEYLQRIATMTIFGIGLFRELGYGAINTRCIG